MTGVQNAIQQYVTANEKGESKAGSLQTSLEGRIESYALVHSGVHRYAEKKAQ